MPRLVRSALAGIGFALFGFALCGLALCGFAPALAAGPEVRVSDNVYLVPDPKAKVITVYMIIRAGCRDEESGQCRGLAHYLEHLVFLGRKAEQDAASANLFAAGQTNAFTSMQTTSYYQTLPVREGEVAADLERLVALFAGRLQKLEAPEDAALRERNVVLQEFNFRRSDSTRSGFYRDMNVKMQPEHPIRQSVIGTRADIDAFSLERARAFHARWYAKSNATFVIYAPVSAEEVKPLVAKYIDPLSNRKVPSRGWLDALRSFTPMDEAVRVEDAETRRTEIYLQRIVRYEEPDISAAGAVNSILADYLNSQIKNSLWDVFVEDRKLATGIHISATGLGAGVLWYTVSATLEEGVEPNQLKPAIEDYIRGLAETGVDESILTRLKRRRVNDRVEVEKEPQRTLSALTSWFSSHGTFDDWNSRAQTYADVTADKVKARLAIMAQPGRQVFGVLAPKGTQK